MRNPHRFPANDDGMQAIELWGGIECTCNRVGDRYFNQIQWTGHDRRADDLDRFAELGIRTLRYPALWEWAAPNDPRQYDWTWCDERLMRLKRLGIRPIVGLVHHGSGPRYTDLTDPSFAAGLSDYAEQLARRFPWIDQYTPVNEPLTTARFGALYGLWYPHLREDRAFAAAILNQCRAIVLAMARIRQIQPQAALVQTEDLGKTYSVPALRYQAEFDNVRRWLTFDLLCGRVDRHHPVGEFFLWLGIHEREFMWFVDNVCPPDVLGVNYYVTSERFLDWRLNRYPASSHGGNRRHRYADVEAVRVLPDGLAGPSELLREAYERYRRPLAITEAHMGCSREEQIRWLWHVWQEAQNARRKGADVRAVTVWSLLGAFDWDSLVTVAAGHYEPGAFDVRHNERRPTAVAEVVSDLASGRVPNHPVLSQPGWWKRSARLWRRRPCDLDESSPAGQPLVITGATGTLGSAFARICVLRGLPFRLLNRQEMDIADADAVARAFDQWEPWAVINAAGYVRVDEAEREAERCRRENVLGPMTLARQCARRGMHFVTFSSDLVFDGRQRQPYCESDPVNPLNCYGRTKAEAEERVLALLPTALVIRSSAFFGPWDNFNFVTIALRTLAQGDVFVAAPTVVSPTYVPDLIQAALDLLIDRATGIWHVAGDGAVSWEQFACAAARRAGFDVSRIQRRGRERSGAPRPSYSALGSERARLLPHWENALDRYFAEVASGRHEFCESSSV